MNIDFMLVVYIIGALVVGFLIFREDIEPEFLIKNKKQKLGASYWGVYNGSATAEGAGEQTIVPPKPCKDMDGAVGRGSYASGKAVNSAR